MRFNELISEFRIQMSNEEAELFERLEGVRDIHSFSERERFTLESLIRKSLVTKINKNGSTMVTRNENQTYC